MHFLPSCGNNIILYFKIKQKNDHKFVLLQSIIATLMFDVNNLLI